VNQTMLLYVFIGLIAYLSACVLILLNP